MNDSFFSAATPTRKRKRTGPPKQAPKQHNNNNAAPKRPKQQYGKKKHDSDLEESENEQGLDDLNLSGGESESSEEEIEETAAEKRVRLAKAYLGKIQDGLDGIYTHNLDSLFFLSLK